MLAILQTYRARTPGSADLYRRARTVLAGGTSGNLRYFPPYPLYFASGQAAQVTDVDGHAYIDCFLANGPLLLGHRHPAVVESIGRHSALGSLLVNPPLLVEVAALLLGLGPDGMPVGKGIPASATANTLLCRYGSVEDLAQVLDRQPDVAAV